MIDDFAAGLDTRKSALTSAAGTLQRMTNAVITPGGEIAKRKAFVQVATLTGTFGLASTESTVYAFAARRPPGPPPTPPPIPTPPPSGVPGVGLVYEEVTTASTALTQTDFDTFDGRIYLATNDRLTGVNHHFYQGTETQGTGTGYYVRTYRSKVYSVRGKNLSFSAVGAPIDWTGTGSGFINLSVQDADGENLITLEVYYDKLAIFSSEATQLWSVDPDPLQDVFDQVLRGAGTTSPLASLQYGSGDVLYLAQSGIRSVKARDSSNSAAVSDIGSPVDGLIQDIYSQRGSAYFNAAIALLEPIVGRFWMIFPNEIFVLSSFPGPKITAWSRYTVPFTIDFAVTCGGHVFLRSGDALYVYGGPNGTSYDNCGVEIRLPYLDMRKPGTNKIFEALDMTISGTWTVRNSFDFNNPDDDETLGVFNAPTWRMGKCPFEGDSSHFSLRFANNDDQPAMISNCAVHYQMADDEA